MGKETQTTPSNDKKEEQPLVLAHNITLKWKGDVAGAMLDDGVPPQALSIIRENSYTSGMIRVPELIDVARKMEDNKDKKLPENDKNQAVVNLLVAMKRYHNSQMTTWQKIYFPEDLIEKAKKGDFDETFIKELQAYGNAMNKGETLNIASQMPEIIQHIINDKPVREIYGVLERFQSRFTQTFGKDTKRNQIQYTTAEDPAHLERKTVVSQETSIDDAHTSFMQTFGSKQDDAAMAVVTTVMHQGGLSGVTEMNVSKALISHAEAAGSPEIFLPDMDHLSCNNITEAEDSITISGSGQYNLFEMKTLERDINTENKLEDKALRDIFVAAKQSPNPQAIFEHELPLFFETVDKPKNEEEKTVRDMRDRANDINVRINRAKNSHNPEEETNKVLMEVLTGKETVTTHMTHVGNYSYSMKIPKNFEQHGLPILPGLMDVEPEYTVHYEATNQRAQLPIDQRILDNKSIQQRGKIEKTENVSLKTIVDIEKSEQARYVKKPNITIDAPPKPKPEPSLWERFKQSINTAFESVKSFFLGSSHSQRAGAISRPSTPTPKKKSTHTQAPEEEINPFIKTERVILESTAGQTIFSTEDPLETEKMKKEIEKSPKPMDESSVEIEKDPVDKLPKPRKRARPGPEKYDLHMEVETTQLTQLGNIHPDSGPIYEDPLRDKNYDLDHPHGPHIDQVERDGHGPKRKHTDEIRKDHNTQDPHTPSR